MQHVHMYDITSTAVMKGCHTVVAYAFAAGGMPAQTGMDWGNGLI